MTHAADPDPLDGTESRHISAAVEYLRLALGVLAGPQELDDRETAARLREELRAAVRRIEELERLLRADTSTEESNV